MFITTTTAAAAIIVTAIYIVTTINIASTSIFIKSNRKLRLLRPLLHTLPATMYP
jgi:hypothetical protein